MPLGKKYAKRKKVFRRRIKRKPKAIVQRGLRPAIYPFKRSVSTVIGLNTSSPPTGWNVAGNNLYRNWGLTLGELDDHLDFVDLFKYYRLKGVRIQMYFSNTVSASEDGNNNSPNSQIMMWLDTNLNGSNNADAGEETTYLNSQTAKKKLCLKSNGRPVDIYMPLRQQNQMYGGTGGAIDYATVKPKWISTNEPTTPHYGLKMMLHRIDNQPFTSGINNSQYCKIIQTVYFQCKKVE